MRWDNLFSDLESQLEYGLTAEEDDLRAEEERLRLGRLTLRDRLMSMAAVSDRGAGYPVTIILRGGATAALRARTFGRDWLAADLVEESSRRSQCIVPLSAISGVALTRRQIRHSLEPRSDAGATGSIADRLGFPFVLRDLCRRRVGVELSMAAGDTLFGTIDRVGRDHLDLAVHDAGEARRESDIEAHRIVTLESILMVRV
jgi:hypothetical protein